MIREDCAGIPSGPSCSPPTASRRLVSGREQDVGREGVTAVEIDNESEEVLLIGIPRARR